MMMMRVTSKTGGDAVGLKFPWKIPLEDPVSGRLEPFLCCRQSAIEPGAVKNNGGAESVRGRSSKDRVSR